ncbi:MAG: glycoside hydrolase family 3 C-terminal domain-containing protein, partial [Pyrinomonadaceae bacterium]
NWENDNLPAILHAWYPGQFGGTAIAETIFGDYNPAGRLPVTFYKSVDQLPPFDDYKMEGRTYRYFRGEPLYPFGYGLSFSRFEYSGLRLPKFVSAGRDLTVSATVKNTGKVAGDEVVQIYLTANSKTAVVPIRSLVGVQRIRLQPGESQIVKFTVASRDMSIVLADGKRVLEPGDLSISVGGEQPGFTGSGKAKTTMTVGGTFKVSGKRMQLPE